MRKTVLVFILLANIVFSNNCDVSFSTYSQAVKYVQSHSFKLTDEIDCNRSSWIRSAKYYSCDGETGFMIFTTDTYIYIHKELPIDIWDEWKEASSLGSFYNENIKHRYHMYLLN